MPGIAGIIGSKKPKDNERLLNRMITFMKHESFYTSGQMISESLKACVGWVAIKGSFSDCMPLWNEKRDICMLFAGENFADSSRIGKLKIDEHEFKNGNASYLVHYYEELGDAFFNELNGRYCGVILDYRKSETIIFNDRYGLNRLYYHEKNGLFFFASEAKSLLAIMPELREIDNNSLAQFFSFGCVLQNKTLFHRISIIPGGAAWSFKQGFKAKKISYFNQNQLESLEPLKSCEYYRQLKETWIRILPRYFRGPERVAFSLTGGKDTRMILAWAQLTPGMLPCYTFGGIYRDTYDAKIARQLAKLSYQPYQIIRLDDAFLGDFPYYAQRFVYITDGNMDLSGSTGLFENSRAREVAPIRLTGNYGQEILRRSVSFKPIRIFSNFLENDFAQLVDNAKDVYFDELQGNRLSFIAFKQLPWHHYARLSSELSQLTLRTPFLDNDLLKLAFQAPLGLGQSDDMQLRLITEGNAEMGKIETDRGLLYQPVPVYTWLRSQFRTLTFRAEYAFDYGMPHALAKINNRLRMLHLESFFLGRHKYYHFRKWYQYELSGYVKEILLDSRTKRRSFFRGAGIENMVNAHIRGNANFTQEIHKLLTVELTYRLFIESL